MSKVALLNGYVRPTLNTQNVHEIQKGRHPLLELISSDFQPNDFYSGGDRGKVQIVTGPNASGKSVYLKQVSLIIFLAHVGSFVPASKANIATVHSIHSRIRATESAALRLSSFMIDLSQVRLQTRFVFSKIQDVALNTSRTIANGKFSGAANLNLFF